MICDLHLFHARDRSKSGISPRGCDLVPSVPLPACLTGFVKLFDRERPCRSPLRTLRIPSTIQVTVAGLHNAELDCEAFGRMLLTLCGFGMRIAVVDEENVNDEPEIVVREPEDEEGR